MSVAALVFSAAALQSISMVGQGYAEKAEAKYNAALYDEKAKMIDVQMGIKDAQYNRLKGKTASTSMANLARAGIMPTGSAAAAIIDTQAQIMLDQSYERYNLESEKNYTLSQASSERRRGRNAVRSGWTNAFTSVLSAGANYGMNQGMANKPTLMDTSSSTRAGKI